MNNDPTKGFSPPIAISAKATSNPNEHRLILTRYWMDSNLSGGSGWLDTDIGDFSSTTWTDIKVQWKISPGGNSILKVYRTSNTNPPTTTLYDFSTGTNIKLGFTSTVGGGPRIMEKMGIYRRAPQPNTFSVLYDQIRVGNRLAAVDPASNFDTWIKGDWAGRWKFENTPVENTHDYDTSGHGNSMDLFGGAYRNISGYIGNRIVFPGTTARVHVGTNTIDPPPP